MIKLGVLCSDHECVTVFIYPSVVCVIVFYCSSVFLYGGGATNETHVHIFPLETEYLIDEQKYMFLIVIHHNLSFFLCGTIYVATETLFIMWLQHALGLFEIASNYVAEAIPEGSDLQYVKEELSISYRKKYLSSAVKTHTVAKVFATSLKDRFVFSYAVLLVFAVISLSINFFRFSLAVQLTHDMSEMFMSLFFSISELVYMFYLNYLIQQILNFGDNFSRILYSTQWYTTPLNIQKIVLIFMIKCSDPIIFTFYGFYNASIEGFSGLVKSTVSYFMVLTSLQ